MGIGACQVPEVAENGRGRVQTHGLGQEQSLASAPEYAQDPTFIHSRSKKFDTLRHTCLVDKAVVSRAHAGF